MNKTIWAWNSLILISIIIGIIWRVEIELNGWKGLIWTTYFHYSIPIGFILFLIWANLILNSILYKKIIFNLILIGIALFSYYLLNISIRYNFSSGIIALWHSLTVPFWTINLLKYAPISLLIVIPISILASLTIINYHLQFKYILISFLGIISSIPISIAILWIFEHKGGADFIHSIKSGIIFPFIVFSIGILIINAKPKASTT